MIYNIIWAQNDAFTNHKSKSLSKKIEGKKRKASRVIGDKFHHFSHFTLYLSSIGFVANFCNFSTIISGLGLEF